MISREGEEIGESDRLQIDASRRRSGRWRGPWIPPRSGPRRLWLSLLRHSSRRLPQYSLLTLWDSIAWRLASARAFTSGSMPRSTASGLLSQASASASSAGSSRPLSPRPRRTHSSALAARRRRVFSASRRDSTHSRDGRPADDQHLVGDVHPQALAPHRRWGSGGGWRSGAGGRRRRRSGRRIPRGGRPRRAGGGCRGGPRRTGRGGGRSAGRSAAVRAARPASVASALVAIATAKPLRPSWPRVSYEARVSRRPDIVPQSSTSASWSIGSDPGSFGRVGDQPLDQALFEVDARRLGRLDDRLPQRLAPQCSDLDDLALVDRPERAVHEVAVEVGPHRQNHRAARVGPQAPSGGR